MFSDKHGDMLNEVFVGLRIAKVMANQADLVVVPHTRKQIVCVKGVAHLVRLLSWKMVYAVWQRGISRGGYFCHRFGR